MKHIHRSIQAVAVGAFWLVLAAPTVPSLSASSFALELNGQAVGYVSSVEGGNAVGEVIKATPVGTPVVKKHLAGVHFEPIALQVGAGMGKPLWQWIASMLRGEQVRTNGTISAFDGQQKPIQQRNFSNALITGVTFPKLDGSSKETALLTLVLTPENVVAAKPSGVVASIGPKQKGFAASNFRLEIDGLDTRRVSKIDAFTVKQKVSADSVGPSRDLEVKPGVLDIPNLTVTFAASSVDSWQRWFDEFVVQGQNDDRQERAGRIVLLGPNLRDELLVITLSNVGIFALRQRSNEANAETISQFEAELYVERMDLSVR